MPKKYVYVKSVALLYGLSIKTKTCGLYMCTHLDQGPKKQSILRDLNPRLRG